MEKLSTLSLETTIRFDSVNALLAEQKELSVPGNVTIQSLEMKGDTEWIYVIADVKGPYNGKVIVQFKLNFDNNTKRFTIQDVNLELADDSVFAKMAGKFVNSMFADKMDKMLEDVVNTKFTAMLNDIFAQLKKLPLRKNGFIGFDAQSYNLYDMRTDAKGLHLTAELTGAASLDY